MKILLNLDVGSTVSVFFFRPLFVVFISSHLFVLIFYRRISHQIIMQNCEKLDDGNPIYAMQWIKENWYNRVQLNTTMKPKKTEYNKYNQIKVSLTSTIKYNHNYIL